MSSPLKISVNLIEDPEKKKRLEEEEKKREEEEEKNKQIIIQPRGEGEVDNKQNVKVDNKGLDEIEVKKKLDEIIKDINLDPMFDPEIFINKIDELNLDREQINKWIQDNL